MRRVLPTVGMRPPKPVPSPRQQTGTGSVESAPPSRLPQATSALTAVRHFAKQPRLRRLSRLRDRSRRSKIILAVIAGIVLLGGAATAAVFKVRHDNEVTEQRERAAAERQEEQERQERAEEAEREEEEAQAELDDLERSSRRLLAKDLQKSITKDANENVTSGVLDGPILRTVCTPVGGGSEDLSEPTGKYECLAVTEDNADGTSSGYSYDATINYDKFSYTWQLSG